MEILSPTHPPCSNEAVLSSGNSPPERFQHGYDRTISRKLVSSQFSEAAGEGGTVTEKVYVAVGKSVEKGVALLLWAFKLFGEQEICILHVHQPSQMIPTLLGRLPASQANSEVVSAYRKEEWENTRKLLINYLSLSAGSNIKISIIITEAEQIKEGIMDLVNKNVIKKLVMGAIPNCVKGKKSSAKASYVAKNAPSFCEIWFVNKGKLAWTKEASGVPSSFPPNSQQEPQTACKFRSQSWQCGMSEFISQTDCLHSGFTEILFPAGVNNWVQVEPVKDEMAFSPTLSTLTNRCSLHCPSNLSSSTSTESSSEYTSLADSRAGEESLCNKLEEVKKEAEASRNEAFAELLKRRNLESEVLATINKVKAFESAHAHEVLLRKQAEDALQSSIQEQEKLLEEREAVNEELHKAMRNIALLENRAQEARHRCEEAAGELKLIQAYIMTLQQERRKVGLQKTEAARRLDRQKSHGTLGGAKFDVYLSYTVDSSELAEFSLLDLQTATCNFSENFMIGQGGYGFVYKGEMLDRTVAIKKLHPHNIDARSDFRQKVKILGILQHPHVVGLIGVCPEAWSLVSEYLPNGNLQDYLSRKGSMRYLNWKTRVQIIAEIASALSFLHSSKPEKIVHGNLKPENILFDSKLSSKLCDCGISRLVPEQTLRCPSFRRYTEQNSAFPYLDPEFTRTGILTPKSDMYSFGLIILQLLTGKAPTGLAIEVSKRMASGKLSSILDLSSGEWPMFVARRLAELGLQCCELNSRDRPELTISLLRELEQLHILEERTVPSSFLCPILKEIMYDPRVAADGFTYEGEALRVWFENGGETSPMTNLKLNHLHLTPNHALRQAIQDWLCKA